MYLIFCPYAILISVVWRSFDERVSQLAGKLKSDGCEVKVTEICNSETLIQHYRRTYDLVNPETRHYTCLKSGRQLENGSL